MISRRIRRATAPGRPRQRLEKFTELIATAIANAEGSARARRVAQKDRGRRRRGAPPDRARSPRRDPAAADRAHLPRTRDDAETAGRAAGPRRRALGRPEGRVRRAARGLARHPPHDSHRGRARAGAEGARASLQRPDRRRREARRAAAGARRGGRLLHRLRGAHQRRKARAGERRRADRRARRRRPDARGSRRRHRRRRCRSRLRHPRPHRPRRGARRDDLDRQPTARWHDALRALPTTGEPYFEPRATAILPGGMPVRMRQRMSNCSQRTRLAGIPSPRKPLASALIIGGGPHM